MEQHAEALVALLESCLNHNLKPSHKDEDPPHAKISSDIISCIFLVSVIFSKQKYLINGFLYIQYKATTVKLGYSDLG